MTTHPFVMTFIILIPITAEHNRCALMYSDLHSCMCRCVQLLSIRVQLLSAVKNHMVMSCHMWFFT